MSGEERQQTWLDDAREQIRAAIEDVNRELRERDIGAFVGPWDGVVEVVACPPR